MHKLLAKLLSHVFQIKYHRLQCFMVFSVFFKLNIAAINIWLLSYASQACFKHEQHIFKNSNITHTFILSSQSWRCVQKMSIIKTKTKIIEYSSRNWYVSEHKS